MNCGIVFGSAKKLSLPPIRWKIFKNYPYQYLVGDWIDCPYLAYDLWECLPSEKKSSSSPYHVINYTTLRKMRSVYKLHLRDWEDDRWRTRCRNLRKAALRLSYLCFWKFLLPQKFKVIFYLSGVDFTE